MAYLYELEIQSFHNGEECERYGIGIFRNLKDAQKTAKRYLKEVPGFRDYYCEYSIAERELVGESFSPLVHTYFGWNLDEQGNEYDIVDGLLYTSIEAAESALAAVKDAYDRQEWALQKWQVGKCEWAEGFIREYPDGQIAPTLLELRKKLDALSQERSMCNIEFEYGDEAQCYLPLAVGDQLFLCAIDDDFLFNGFTVRRLRDIYELLPPRSGIYQTIAEKEGLTSMPVPDVELTNWKSVFISLKWLDKPVIVEREYEPEFFRLGRIEDVKKDRVIMRYFDADGVWHDPVEIPYQGITSVTFDDRYSNIFSKYV